MKYIITTVFIGLAFAKAFAQGPPITGDSPNLFGTNSFTTRVLTESRKLDNGDAFYAPLMLHYVVAEKTALAVHIPYINYNVNGDSGSGLADIKLIAKQRFFQKDGMAKTLRIEAKTIQTLPTGDQVNLMDLSTGNYAGYYGALLGYETLKYGLTTEIGYNWMPDGTQDEFRIKGGAGLPLLKPQYPNKQLNLYFEYTSSWNTERDEYQLLYAQGVQFASKNFTFDLSVQFPLIQEIKVSNTLQRAVFIGTRYTF